MTTLTQALKMLGYPDPDAEAGRILARLPADERARLTLGAQALLVVRYRPDTLAGVEAETLAAWLAAGGATLGELLAALGQAREVGR